MGEKVAADELRQFVDRICRLREEARGLAAEERDLLADAAELGFDVAALDRLVTLVMMDPAERREAAEVLELYSNAIGLD